jgi:NADPH-dependent curcumin reductase CurA
MDIYYDNVGGELLDLCLDRLRVHARIVLCGGISRYNETGELLGPKNYFNLIFRRARMEGFLLSDYIPRFDEALVDLRTWVAQGSIAHRATVLEGFEQLPRALIELFQGRNIGKMMVKT